MNESKENKNIKVLILADLQEGRYSYFAAGVSKHFKTSVYHTNKEHNQAFDNYRRSPHSLYLWLYDNDCDFTYCEKEEQILKVDDGHYDMIIVQDVAAIRLLNQKQYEKEGVGCFGDFDRGAVIDLLEKLKKKTKKIYWFEPGEHFYFTFGSSCFWDLVDGVFKSNMFKKDFAHIVRDGEQVFKYQWYYPPSFFNQLIKENSNLKIENNYHKILPCPFPPSIVDEAVIESSRKQKKIYDITGNFQGNSGMRFETMKMIEKNLNKKYKYLFDYGMDGYKINYKNIYNTFNPFLIKKWNIGRVLFQLKYGRMYYPKPFYIHNLSYSRCHLGLGHHSSSLRTGDVMGVGAVLFNWNQTKFDSGYNLKDGYNYVSIGDREQMTKDNFVLKKEYSSSILEIVNNILSNPSKQKEIIANQYKTYENCFKNPKQYIKNFFIKKINEY